MSNKKIMSPDLNEPINFEDTNVYLGQWKFLSLNEALDIISRQVDKLFLLWLLSSALFAVYFNGSYEIPLIGILITTTGSFLTMQAVQDQNNSHVKELLGQSTLVLAAILFPLFFFLFLNAHDLFQLIFDGKYNDSVPVFLISCCIIPLRIMNYTAILQGYHKGKDILHGSLIGLVSKLIISIPLYLIWDVRGVALAFIIGTFIQILYYLVQTARVLGSSLGKLIPFIRLLGLFILTGSMLYLPYLLLIGKTAILSITVSAGITLLSSISLLIFIMRKKDI